MPALPRRADQHGDHFIVSGDGPLAYRITEELSTRYGERVTVLLPSRRRRYGPQIGALPRVRVLEHPELSIQAFTDGTPPGRPRHRAARGCHSPTAPTSAPVSQKRGGSGLRGGSGQL